MSQARTVVLDNEAVQALSDVGHRQHRRMLAIVEAVAARNRRRAGSARLVVPTSVRVEAGWVRTAQRATAINRLRIEDHPLDATAADRAAEVRQALGVSAVDAHLATVIAATPGPHAVVTSDVDDVQRIAKHLAAPINVVRA
jgi:hypothetical protein